MLGLAGALDFGPAVLTACRSVASENRGASDCSFTPFTLLSSRKPARTTPWGPWPTAVPCTIASSTGCALHWCQVGAALWELRSWCCCTFLCLKPWIASRLGSRCKARPQRQSSGHPPLTCRASSPVRRCPRHPWKTVFLLYLVGVDANTLRIGSALWPISLLGGSSTASGVQLYAHGFHEGRPVFSTGPVPTTSHEEDLCEVMPLGRPGNHLLAPSRRPRRQVAMFLGRSGGEPDLEPCPIIFSVDERLHICRCW